MLDRERESLYGKFYDYIFIVNIHGVNETHILEDQKLLNYHIHIAKYMHQTFTAYIWNVDHNCYIQSDCYPICPMPCLKG